MVESQEMPSADPSLATDEVSFTTLNNVYEGIYRLDKDNKPALAGAAEKATVSEDGLVYKVKLREESKWSDGKPVTAADYVYGWQRTVDPATASEYAYMFEPVKNAEKISKGELPKEELGIKAINDHELEITLETATHILTIYWLFLLSCHNVKISLNVLVKIIQRVAIKQSTMVRLR